MVVKLSNDLDPRDLFQLLDQLFASSYDGINLGNTSTNYSFHRERIASPEQKLFDFFSENFEGGVSGKSLKPFSLELAATAVSYI